MGNNMENRVSDLEKKQFESVTTLSTQIAQVQSDICELKDEMKDARLEMKQYSQRFESASEQLKLFVDSVMGRYMPLSMANEMKTTLENLYIWKIKVDPENKLEKRLDGLERQNIKWGVYLAIAGAVGGFVVSIVMAIIQIKLGKVL